MRYPGVLGFQLHRILERRDKNIRNERKCSRRRLLMIAQRQWILWVADDVEEKMKYSNDAPADLEDGTTRYGITNEKILMSLYDLTIDIMHQDDDGVAWICELLTNPFDFDDERGFVVMVKWLTHHQNANRVETVKFAHKIAKVLFPNFFIPLARIKHNRAYINKKRRLLRKKSV